MRTRPNATWCAAILTALVLGTAAVSWPTHARQAADEGQDRQKLGDQLTELRVRVELLTMEADAERQQLQQSMQMLKQMEFAIFPGAGFGGMGGFGMGGGVPEGYAGRPTEEQAKGMEERRRKAEERQRKQQDESRRAARSRLDEMEAKYLETNKELDRATQRKAELERRLGEPKASRPELEQRLEKIERKLDAVLKELKSSKAR
jgi:DNA repair exonuclease SbcCD ATPase subunit